MPPRAGFMIAYKRYGEVFHSRVDVDEFPLVD